MRACVRARVRVRACTPRSSCSAPKSGISTTSSTLSCRGRSKMHAFVRVGENDAPPRFCGSRHGMAWRGAAPDSARGRQGRRRAPRGTSPSASPACLRACVHTAQALPARTHTISTVASLPRWPSSARIFTRVPTYLARARQLVSAHAHAQVEHTSRSSEPHVGVSSLPESSVSSRCHQTPCPIGLPLPKASTRKVSPTVGATVSATINGTAVSLTGSTTVGSTVSSTVS